MTKESRYNLGKAWKEGKTGKNDFSKYYEEFKADIDAGFNSLEEAEKANAEKAKKKEGK